ncbi:hypothetical protein, partial [Bacteroides sp. 519]|uniref:hypothetical protein n=1 Tax=Bacteroides sp. 519 TaxID=2302937 RepID=UPI003519F950|nr:hypothetical protein [Bacteroides sp. 519]
NQTGKFVMWFHLELKGKGYSAARAALAVSDTPVKYIHHIYEQDSVLWVASVGMGIIKGTVLI